MPMTSPSLLLPYIQPSQAQKHVTHNEALDLLDAIVQLRVRGWGTTAPPAAPQPGDVHAVGAPATGEWAGQEGRLAAWDGAAWAYLAPRRGWRAWGLPDDQLRVWTGTAWVAYAPALQDVPGLGVNTSSDAANRLAVSSPATLLSHDGAGHQVKVNKAGPAETASLLFQSNWTGHAEMGLAGGLDFALKVSDGAAWSEALTVARATGRVTLPAGVTVNGALGGTAVQQGPADATAGRLLAVGAWGLGGLLPPVGNAGVVDWSLAPGRYAFDAGTGSTGGPAQATRGLLIHARRAAAAGETQLFVVEAGSNGAAPGTVFGRARGTGAWGAWVCGSIAEGGQNSNGGFLRHQNGTQQCWHVLDDAATAWATASGALFSRATPLAWTYPAAFSAAPVVSVAVLRSDAPVAGASLRTVSTTAAQAQPWSAVSLAASTPKALHLCAVGRWY